MGFAGGVGFGGRSFGLPGTADGEPWGWGLGCSVVAAEAEGEAGSGAEAGGVPRAVVAALFGGEPGAAAAAALAGGDAGAAAALAGRDAGAVAAAALAGDDGEALAWVELEAESGADFVTDGALVIGGGLCTGGFATEVALWTGLGF